VVKLDLHTHSVASVDGGIKPKHYIQAIEDGVLDCIAITDHNTAELALELHKNLGESIIVGEEIMTGQGELIGLFLTETIKPHQSALATVRAIKEQGGLVYLPHPFETVRKGMSATDLQRIADFIDIVEVHNARAVFQNKGPEAVTWTTLNHKARAASSDAHGRKALGHTYTIIESMPDAKTLVELLNTHERLVTKRPPLRSLLYPKMHTMRQKVVRRHR
jgi:predicted metal-dependent phosphoesterase TrpH